ncbi:MAG TPA: GNAT family N-acetyltransferase [Nocardioidaceae bacterium]|nr:GNAT family N-acetyltransferase [Nocardioidaceae bacterium]
MSLLSTLEAYYDAAPRPTATTEEVGPFTLFLRKEGDGWPYYARPSLGYDGPVTSAQVEAVRDRQRELEVPQSIEWVHETTPTLLAAAREAGLHVAECPLLVLPDGAEAFIPPLPEGFRVAMLTPDSPELATVVAAVSAGFAGRDDLEERSAGRIPDLMRSGLMAMAEAYDGQGVVGGGSHSPRGTTTELTGIAVLPRARRQGVGAAITAALVADARATGISTVFLSAQDDTVARVYERIGFQRVGTACIAEPADV